MDMNTLPNPAQLRAMARPAPAPRPCVPGRHCERRARDLGACIAGECNPPASAGVAPFRTAKQQGIVAGDGQPCPNTHDPDCRHPECNCRTPGVNGLDGGQQK